MKLIYPFSLGPIWQVHLYFMNKFSPFIQGSELHHDTALEKLNFNVTILVLVIHVVFSLHLDPQNEHVSTSSHQHTHLVILPVPALRDHLSDPTHFRSWVGALGVPLESYCFSQKQPPIYMQYPRQNRGEGERCRIDSIISLASCPHC